MNALAVAAPQAPTPEILHTRYLELLPHIETHGQITFRYMRCPHRRADALQEMCALGWKWHLQLAQRGKDAREFVTSFVTFLARSVKCGRRLAGMEKSKDAFCQRTQQRRGFRIEPLPASMQCPHDDLYGTVNGQRQHDAFEERLQDNRKTPVPEQVAFRLDWPRFLATLSKRDQDLALFLALNHSGKQAAQQFGLSPGRITQLRQGWCRDWRRFQDAE